MKWYIWLIIGVLSFFIILILIGMILHHHIFKRSNKITTIGIDTPIPIIILFNFPQLLKALENKEDINIPAISYKNHISKDVAMADLKYVESLDSPYQLECDKNDLSKRLL